MEQKQEIKPMTPEQKEAEAAFAKKIYRELSDPSPETSRKIRQAIKVRRQSEATSLIDQKRNPIKP